MGLLPIHIKARIHGRPYWEVSYRDGSTVDETQRDWTELVRKELVEVRLHCPNGQLARLGNTVDASDRLFQFKVAIRGVGVGKQSIAMVIGIVHGLDGSCTCAAWQYPGELIQFEDNVQKMAYQNVGRLGFAAVGIKPD